MIVLDNHIHCREFSEGRKIAIASEKNKTYRLINSSLKHIEKWKIDKCIFKNETTCDFLFLVNRDKEIKDFIWIELKGADIDKAAFQILSTILKIEPVKGNVHHARIIPSRNPNPSYRGTVYRKLENFVRQNGGTITNQNKLLEETI